MNHGSRKRPQLRAFAAEEEGGAAVETALLAGLAALSAFLMKNMVATPLLAFLTKASRVLSQALG